MDVVLCFCCVGFCTVVVCSIPFTKITNRFLADHIITVLYLHLHQCNQHNTSCRLLTLESVIGRYHKSDNFCQAFCSPLAYTDPSVVKSYLTCFIDYHLCNVENGFLMNQIIQTESREIQSFLARRFSISANCSADGGFHSSSSQPDIFSFQILNQSQFYFSANQNTVKSMDESFLQHYSFKLVK